MPRTQFSRILCFVSIPREAILHPVWPECRWMRMSGQNRCELECAWYKLGWHLSGWLYIGSSNADYPLCNHGHRSVRLSQMKADCLPHFKPQANNTTLSK